MSSRSKILIVDDDVSNCKRLQKLLAHDYRVELAHTGDQCLAKLESYRPDICLLDIVLPDMDGYDICSHIRSHSELDDTIVIFISGRLNTDSIIKGYESGGYDYVTKPIVDNVLLQKVELNLKMLQKNRKLREEVQVSTNTAFTAMRETSDYGQLVNFMRESLECTTYNDLSAKVFKIVDEMGLRCSMRIYTANDEIDMDPTGYAKPLESELLTRCRDQGRFFDFKNRTIVNFEHVSLLVKNMPIDDKEKYGRFRDILATLLTAVNAQINILDQINRSQSEHDVLLNSTIKDVHTAVKKIEEAIQSQESRSMETMENLVREMENSMVTIDLTDSQETQLLTILNKAAEELASVYQHSLDIDRQFENVLSKLSKLILGKAA